MLACVTPIKLTKRIMQNDASLMLLLLFANCLHQCAFCSVVLVVVKAVACSMQKRSQFLQLSDNLVRSCCCLESIGLSF